MKIIFSAFLLSALSLPAISYSQGTTESLTTRHFHITVATSRRQDVPQLAPDLEAFRAHYATVIGSMVPLNEVVDRLEVFALDGNAGLSELGREVADLEPGAGLFPGPLQSRRRALVAIDASGLLGAEDLAALFHGVAHLCNTTLLYGEGVSGSWWVREGLAAYLSQTSYSRGAFALGKTQRSSGYISDVSTSGRVSLSVASAARPRKSLDKAVDAFRKGMHIRLPELLGHPADTPWPDDRRRDLAAVQSWMMIHFLLHGPEEDLRKRLSGFLDMERRGEGGAEAFRRVISGDLDRLEPLLYKHVKRMD